MARTWAPLTRSQPFSTSWNTTALGERTVRAHRHRARRRRQSDDSAAINVQVSNVAATGLVAAYAFNETAGTTASDAIGQRPHGHGQRRRLERRRVGSAAR